MSPDSTWTTAYAAENSGQLLINICVVFATLELCFLVALASSWYFNRNANSETAVPRAVFLLVLVGYIFDFGGVALGILQITIGGAGYHAKILDDSKVRVMFQLIKSHEFVYIMSIPFSKLALMIFYVRMLSRKILRCIIYFTAFIVVAACIFGLVAGFVNCQPFYAFWNRQEPMHCALDVMAVFRYYSIPNLVVNAVLLALPAVSLRTLKQTTLTRVVALLTIIMAGLGAAAAALRFVAFLHTNIFDDITYLSVPAICWTIIEPGIYLITATIPALQPLLQRMIRKSRRASHPPSRPLTTLSTSSRKRSKRKTKSAMTLDATSPGLATKKSHRSLRSVASKSSPLPPPNSPFAQAEAPGTPETPQTGMGMGMTNFLFTTPRVGSPVSTDEESMVCMDAITQERFASEGRNPDGTLTSWSLAPVGFSPLRTSFLGLDERARD